MIATIVITALITAAVVAIIANQYRKRKNGQSGCGCGCSGCAMSEECHKK